MSAKGLDVVFTGTELGTYPNIYKWLRMIKGLCLIHKRRMDCSLNVGKTD